MGDKVAARRTMQSAGVPVIPGSEVVSSIQAALGAAEEIGYPVLLKAAAGGGGKGMRTVYRPEEMPSAFRASTSEAQSAFGDGRVYVEKLLEDARHIEFQILADHFGHVVHLGERECSIQRRHQKLIEEAPSVALDDDLRRRMGDVAVRAAQAINYASVGTIEFLLAKGGTFYFLEMNTRLQVEHPVTEMVTGIDLVKEQLRIAAGRKLRYEQDDIHPKGWAIECRISAEDPYNNFMPSIGRVMAVFEPSGPGVRLESGVYAGFEVSLYYDPLIAKLVIWGETRGEAILRMRRALKEYRILGIKTTIPLHLRIMDSPRFIAGQIDTTFIESDFYKPPLEEIARQHQRIAALTAALLLHQRRQNDMTRLLLRQRTEPSPWRLAGRRSQMQRG